MNENYIHLKDVTLDKLKSTVVELLSSMEIQQCLIYQHKENTEFILTFPNGISNEMFIFFYCALMAPGLTNSNELLGWFLANDDMTIYEQNGDFSLFKKKTYSKKIMMTPDGDDKGNVHQYGITENGKEIHFGMDGTYKILEKTTLKYLNPISSLKGFYKIELVEKPIKMIKKNKTLIGRIKYFLGI